MWDFFKYLVDKINLKDFTMLIVFLFLAFAFVPTEVHLYFNPKTPAFFPDWLSLGNVFNVIISLIALLCWQALVKFISNKCEERKNAQIERKWKNVLESLSDEEMEVIYAITKNHFQPKMLDSTPVVIGLLAKNVIEFAMTDNWGCEYYRLNPQFEQCFLNAYTQSCGE